MASISGRARESSSNNVTHKSHTIERERESWDFLDRHAERERGLDAAAQRRCQMTVAAAAARRELRWVFLECRTDAAIETDRECKERRETTADGFERLPDQVLRKEKS